MTKCVPWWLILGACVIFGSRLNLGSARLLDPECGLPPIRRRVAGGQTAIEHSTPWMVFLHNKTKFLCGGSLISKAYVLTAAHCVLPVGKLLFARLGEYDWGPQKPCIRRHGCISSERDYNVSDIYPHPDYKPTLRDDVALLKLDKEVRYTAHVRPICVVVKDYLVEWQQYVARLETLSMSGWGATKNRSTSLVLQAANLNQVNITTCRNKYKYPVDGSHICAGDPQKYACNGDSGGPLGFMHRINGTYFYVQVGIVSYGWLPCRGVSVFANVMNYSNWIAGILRQGTAITTPSLVNRGLKQQNTRPTVTLKRRRLSS